MTREELIKEFDSTIYLAKQILIKRNKIYAKEDDALFNIRQLGTKGILTQIREKCTRFENMIELKVKDEEMPTLLEHVNDSCLDIINYSFLLKELIENI